jgi:hypothetical protein
MGTSRSRSGSKISFPLSRKSFRCLQESRGSTSEWRNTRQITPVLLGEHLLVEEYPLFLGNSESGHIDVVRLQRYLLAYVPGYFHPFHWELVGLK